MVMDLYFSTPNKVVFDRRSAYIYLFIFNEPRMYNAGHSRNLCLLGVGERDMFKRVIGVGDYITIVDICAFMLSRTYIALCCAQSAITSILMFGEQVHRSAEKKTRNCLSKVKSQRTQTNRIFCV